MSYEDPIPKLESALVTDSATLRVRNLARRLIEEVKHHRWHNRELQRRNTELLERARKVERKDEMFNDRKVITLCGSTKFKDEYMTINARETLLGHIVLSVGFFHHLDKVPITAEQKKAVDELHFDKIRMSDEILVINPNGYIGESTTNEIACAMSGGKQVRFLDEAAGNEWLETNSHKMGQLIAKLIA